MPETTGVSLPPRTHHSQRWPRKWATLGGRGTPSMTNGDDVKTNGNGHRTSLFRKASTISRTNPPEILDENNSLKKSRSLINVLRSKLNSPAVLRRFRTKSRENVKSVVTEIQEEPRKIRKRDPSPMRRLTQRLAQLTRSNTQHSSIDATATVEPAASPTPATAEEGEQQQQDQVDHINACYDEIRAKYFDTNTISALSQHPCAPAPPATERLKEMLSTTTASSIDYYDRPNPDRSLSNISINGSLLSHDLLNNSQQNVPSTSPPLTVRTPDDPLLVARKQSNIKLNCMLSGYGYRNPFGSNTEKLFGQQHDLFKFHHYHDVGKYKFDSNFSHRMYSSMRTRPISRSIDSFRRATTTIESDVPAVPTTPSEKKNDDEDEEIKQCTSKIFIQPAASVQVKTFVTSSMPTDPPMDDELERNFLRAVDRVLGMGQPIYDTPMKDPCEQNGDESPNVELVDRTGEFMEGENHPWQSSAVYEDQQVKNEV